MDPKEPAPAPLAALVKGTAAVAPPSVSVKSAAAQRALQGSTGAAAAAAPDSETGHRRLSKAERKALKKRREQERLERDRDWRRD